MAAANSALARQAEYAAIGNAWLQKGLSADEKGEVVEAIQYYTKGTSILRECLQTLTFNSSERAAARPVQSKMQKNITEFEERVRKLSAQYPRLAALATASAPPTPPTISRTESPTAIPASPPPSPPLAKRQGPAPATGAATAPTAGFWSRLFGRSGTAAEDNKTPPSPPSPRATRPRTPPADTSATQPRSLVAGVGVGLSPYTGASSIIRSESAPAPTRAKDREPPRYAQHTKSYSSHLAREDSAEKENERPKSRPKVVPKSVPKTVTRTAPRQTAAAAATEGRHQAPPSTADVAKQLKQAGIDGQLLDSILGSIIPKGNLNISWDDISGLAQAKQALYEAAILPLQRPDLFTGLRTPARGILLFGPPGTGKTMLGKAVASSANATFFNISASSLTSKYVGEGEKLVKALFLAAAALQPSVVFMDEIDSLLTARSGGEHEASRRLKTEFMVQMEGLNSPSEHGCTVLVIGATNRPGELDDAVLRRFPKRLHIPLPDYDSRLSLWQTLLEQQNVALSDDAVRDLARATNGYSSSDITNACREALMFPIRELGIQAASVSVDALRKMKKSDFVEALKVVKPTVAASQLESVNRWAAQFGSAA
eukprot:TRINITY_DN8479_c0_g1_i1.p1 TRINITY_DN8479_c0_g1~~TRINITY_DN8479_c0_g1_i1.p1  ORF type:complete len:615 (-),score=95.66 TRINITY_DN8479_c0_g1_i1:52-1854(-)